MPRNWTLGCICIVQAGGSWLGGAGVLEWVGFHLQSFAVVDVEREDGVWQSVVVQE